MMNRGVYHPIAVARVANAIALLEKSRGATVGGFLISRIHESFTRAADKLYAAGEMDEAQRIALSSCIGDALAAFDQIADKKAPGVLKTSIDQKLAVKLMEIK